MILQLSSKCTYALSGRMFPATFRSLSTNGTIAVEKLRNAVEEYRTQNYTQELPSRCKKELMRAVDINEDGFIVLDEVEKLMKNIGAGELISRQDIEVILSEAGEPGPVRAIRVDEMMKLL